MKVSLSAVLATANYDLYVYDSAGRQLGGSLNRAGMADAIGMTYFGTGTAVVYLQVRYVSGGTGASNGRYALSLTR